MHQALQLEESCDTETGGIAAYGCAAGFYSLFQDNPGLFNDTSDLILFQISGYH